MPVVAVQGGKGGVGASLVSTNLACALALKAASVLVDLHNSSGGDDLLLDLKPKRSWVDLLPVSGELKLEHLRIAASVHPTGLHVLAAHRSRMDDLDLSALGALIEGLISSYRWVVLDLPTIEQFRTRPDLFHLDFHLIISTPDPIALRAVRRWRDTREVSQLPGVGLILNQYSNRHPAGAVDLARAIGLPLLAAIPVDLRATGFQINFGRACVEDSRSSFGKSILRLAARLQKITNQQGHNRVRESAGGEGTNSPAASHGH